MSSKVKVGVIGVGHMGRLHLKKLLSDPLAEVIGAVEPDVAKRVGLEREFPIRVFGSVSEILFEADAVVIAAPTSAHYRLAKQAFEAGVDVLVEKPATASVEETEELCKLAESRERIFQVGLLERYRLDIHLPLPAPSFLSIRRYTEKVGREPAVDVVNDLMIHDLDLLLTAFQEEPIEVDASGWQTVSPTSDLVHAWFRFPSGRRAFLAASRVSTQGERRLDWCSPQGQFTLSLQSEFDALAAQTRKFLENVSLRRKPHVDGWAGLQCQRLADRVLAALQSSPYRPQKGREAVHEV